MFREMRRKERLLPYETSLEVLKNGSSGVLALAGGDGYPYAVPLSYAYEDGNIYFHSAPAGKKLDCILQSNKVSFCVVDSDEPVPERFTTKYRSVVVFGSAKISDGEEKKRGIALIAKKYASGAGRADIRAAHIEKTFNHLCVITLTIEHITGKSNFEYVLGQENI